MGYTQVIEMTTKLKCGHTKEQHEKFKKMSPVEQETIRNFYGCECED